MNRFERGSKLRLRLGNAFLTILIFLAMLFSFLIGINSFSESAKKNQLDSATMAVTRAMMQCYSIEGVYPKNYSYLKENYGVIVDENKYIVSYDCFASNIMPTITILPR